MEGDLHAFVEVAGSGGVSAAARWLGVAKSVVSRRLARLENELGAQLLAKTTRRAMLMEAGTSFRGHASRMCTKMDAAREDLYPTRELRCLLRITAPASFGPMHFAPVIADMTVQHPSLHVHTHYNDRYVDLVKKGFDCNIRVGYPPDCNLVARRIGSFPVNL